MKHFKLIFCLFIGHFCTISAQNQTPVILTMNANVDWPNHNLTIQYTVEDTENDPLEVSLFFSKDGGKTYTLGAIPTTGDVGFPVTPGGTTVHTINCDVQSLVGVAPNFTVKLVADDKQPIDIQSIVNEVDSTRLRADLEFVQGIRHRATGLPHLNAVRDSMKHLFSNVGLYSEEQTFSYTGGYTGRNIIGTNRGTAQAEKVVVVDAHYDSVSNAPGADDNGSGTVGVWEIARLLSRYPAKKSLRFIGFDLEESGLIGSIKYVTNGIPAGDQIDAVLNFEMIGYYSEAPFTQELPAGFDLLFPDAYTQVVTNQNRGDFLTNVGNAYSASLTAQLQAAATQYVPALKVISLNVPGNGQLAADLRRSDHAPFWDGGFKALMLTDGANFRNHCYHTPSDTLDGKLSFTFMSNVVKATLATAANLVELQHADYQTVSFQGLVGTNSAPDCAFQAFVSAEKPNWLQFNAGNCNINELSYAIYDMNGASISRGAQHVLPDTWSQISLPNLPSGIYLARFTYRGGFKTVKFVVE
ncbi:MAG: M28 family peptidase [Bacteroidota bacterium]